MSPDALHPVSENRPSSVTYCVVEKLRLEAGTHPPPTSTPRPEAVTG